jgi:starvation-inducible outer membrane lipoprotein
MRKMMLFVATGALVLSGCASIPGADPYAELDLNQVARIENAARTVGVNVYWFNLPLKPASSVN